MGMSQIVQIQGFEITSISALNKAAQRIGEELIRTSGKYDYQIKRLSIFFKKNSTLGKVKYETEADTGYSSVRSKLNQLRQYYVVELAKEVYRKKGYRITEKIESDGTIRLRIIGR